MHPLDNPAWHALTGPHAALAEGDGLARRYPVDVAPFVALPDEPPTGAWAALRALVGGGNVAAMFRAPLAIPEAWKQLLELPCVQMVATSIGDLPFEDAVELDDGDVPEMFALVEATEPGPFLQRTIELGNYIGLRDGGRLVAMAGCRLRLDGYREISAVCTLPSHRGRGIAAGLVGNLCARITSDGDTPILHALTTNENAIRLYRTLGFEVRDEFNVQILRSPE